MPSSPIFEICFTGDYSLAESIALAAATAFVSPMRSPANGGASVLDIAFPLEGSWSPVGLRLRQDGGHIRAAVVANPDVAPLADIAANVARVLSLDVEGGGFAEIAAHDPVVAVLQRQRPGIRPVMFPTPYECAARAIIGQRLYVRQASALQARIAASTGVALDFGDHVEHAFPSPMRLAELTATPGLSDRKVDQLRMLGAAAKDGWLDAARLRGMPHDVALSHLQELPGIGPFSADLILLRGAGDPDAFPHTELRLHRAMAVAYGLGEGANLAALEKIADGWRPYRSWVGLLLRNAHAFR